MTSIVNLMKRYGPIMAMKFPKQPKPVIMVGSQELVHELCDQERFIKNVSGALQEVRSVAKDGTYDFDTWHAKKKTVGSQLLIPDRSVYSVPHRRVMGYRASNSDPLIRSSQYPRHV